MNRVRKFIITRDRFDYWNVAAAASIGAVMELSILLKWWKERPSLAIVLSLVAAFFTALVFYLLVWFARMVRSGEVFDEHSQ
jgi:hypothetical protein